MPAKCSLLVTAFLAAAALAATPDAACAQGNGNKSGKGGSAGSAEVSVSASITLTKGMQVEIREYYDRHPVGGVDALPPGIRMRLARGKPLPPGIAKKFAPGVLHSRLRLPDGYRIFEVGADILLVEVATSIVHDILRDAVR